MDPFAALGIPATLDALEVKRGYFEALRRHPPHQDPDGFRRVREAYERLSSPGALGACYAQAPFDAAAALAGYRARFDEALDRARASLREKAAATDLGQRFAEQCSSRTLAEAVAGARSGRR